MENDNIGSQELTQFAATKRMFDYEEAKAKVPYWQAAGKAFFPEEFHNAWDIQVENYGANEVTLGIGLDQGVQTLGMLKSGATIEQIGGVLSTFSNALTVTDVILQGFVEPEVLSSIRSSIEANKARKV